MRQALVARGDGGHDEQPVNHLVMEPGWVGSGGNGGFQAFNLVLQWGADLTVLMGFDMRSDDPRGAHWHEDHPAGMNNPGPAQFADWMRHFHAASAEIRAMGRTVINATPGSALECFNRASLDEILHKGKRSRP